MEKLSQRYLHETFNIPLASDIADPPVRLQATKATPEFEQSWREELERVDKLLDKSQSPANLRKSIWRVVRWELLAIGLVKVIGDTAVVASPLVLIFLLEYVNRSKLEDTTTTEGFIYVSLFFLLGVLNSITFNWFWQVGKDTGLIF
jgi:hypothetical protein